MSWSLELDKCPCADSGVERRMRRGLKVLGGLPPGYLGVNDRRLGRKLSPGTLYYMPLGAFASFGQQ
jgi:hypothetical protein